MIETKKANRLINAASPYLLQHAYNPVDWFEWSDEAIEKAKRENKPILVSIGYSSCHWCHVMEREVFEKEEIARIMNDHLVCIKVDREERPDIDHIYMEAVQAMGVKGGWPLNVFLTPDQKPFYGGTYFPPDQWVQVIGGINNAYTNRRDEIEASATELTNLLSQQDTSRFRKDPVPTELKNDLELIYNRLHPAFDKIWGGLEKAPKFIMPSVWRLLLRYYHLTRKDDALQHIILTLKKIAMGGIYDQIGGGFSRYSVDQYWFVPHFEKMLYDNAQLMSLYAEAYALTNDEEFKTVILETFEWLQTEMMDGQGGFYSALDADSEGEEGKFYIWTAGQLREILGAEADLFIDYYSIKEQGNWEAQKNILMRVQTEESFLQKHQLPAAEWKQKLRSAKDQLLAVRDKRIRPGLDDKIITGWNAMMVVGLVDAYKILGNENFLRVALSNMKFLEKELTEGLVLFRSYKDKRSNVKGFLDDYAYVVQACISLYQVTFDEYWIHRAKALAGHAVENFLDSSDGFFQYARQDAEKLIASRKEIFDNVIPASNSVMAQNLYHLGIIFDDEKWKTIAEKMTMALSHLITSEPNYMSNWGIVYSEMKKGMAEVVLIGKNIKGMALSFMNLFQPFALTMAKETNSELPLLADKATINGMPTIYVCYNKTCQKPVNTIEEAVQQLKTF
ncbi:MAG: thioredoxin domain-containing protein [Cyclobacteriaceae bacterium]